MTGHKCELIQLNSHSLKFTDTLDGRINEWEHSWPEGELSYRLNSHSDDFKKQWQTRAVTVALRTWQLRIKNLKFRRERNPSVHVDINVEFEDLDHFDGAVGVLAHAYYPGQGDVSGDCHINDEWDWAPGVHLSTISKPPLLPILMHEFGHSLGLVHDIYDAVDIMYPSFPLGSKKNKLGSRSIARMQERYGKRGLASYILAYFQMRRNRGSDFR